MTTNKREIDFFTKLISEYVELSKQRGLEPFVIKPRVYQDVKSANPQTPSGAYIIAEKMVKNLSEETTKVFDGILEGLDPDQYAHPIYAGSVGDFKGGQPAAVNPIIKHLLTSTRPYHFDSVKNLFLYGPTDAESKPKGYQHQIPISDIVVTIIPMSYPLFTPAVVGRV